MFVLYKLCVWDGDFVFVCWQEDICLKTMRLLLRCWQGVDVGSPTEGRSTTVCCWAQLIGRSRGHKFNPSRVKYPGGTCWFISVRYEAGRDHWYYNISTSDYIVYIPVSCVSSKFAECPISYYNQQTFFFVWCSTFEWFLLKSDIPEWGYVLDMTPDCRTLRQVVYTAVSTQFCGTALEFVRVSEKGCVCLMTFRQRLWLKRTPRWRFHGWFWVWIHEASLTNFKLMDSAEVDVHGNCRISFPDGAAVCQCNGYLITIRLLSVQKSDHPMSVLHNFNLL